MILPNDVARCPGQSGIKNEVTGICPERETCKRYLAGQADESPWSLWQNFYTPLSLFTCLDKIEVTE